MSDSPTSTNSDRIAFFPTCVVDSVAPQVGVSAVRVLNRLGFRVSVPAGATCCGQPAWNAGFATEAAKVAHTTLVALESEAATRICVPAGSCATMIRVFWPELFHKVGDQPAVDRAKRIGRRVREFSELVNEKAAQVKGRFPHKVAYHHSCHMLRELGLRDEPLELLRRLEGTTTVHWNGDDRCCGFGGTFSIKQPETSVAMADDKIEGITDSEAEALIGCDQSCLMHMEGRMRRLGNRMPVKHLAEVLDEAGSG